MERLYKGRRIISSAYKSYTNDPANWKVRFQIIVKNRSDVIGNMTEPVNTFPSQMAAEVFGISQAKEIIDGK